MVQPWTVICSPSMMPKAVPMFCSNAESMTKFEFASSAMMSPT